MMTIWPMGSAIKRAETTTKRPRVRRLVVRAQVLVVFQAPLHGGPDGGKESMFADARREPCCVEMFTNAPLESGDDEVDIAAGE